MGMWTGMLNNKVGNFKFIYVDIILEAETTPRKIKVHRGSKRAKPKTLQELLERVHLQVSKHISSFVWSVLFLCTCSYFYITARAKMAGSSSSGNILSVAQKMLLLSISQLVGMWM